MTVPTPTGRNRNGCKCDRCAQARRSAKRYAESEPAWSPTPVRGIRFWSVVPYKVAIPPPLPPDPVWDLWLEPLNTRTEYLLHGVVTPWYGPTMDGAHRTNDRSDPPHSAPHFGCLCGINALKRFDHHEMHSALGTDGVVGVVELTGVVHEYEHGYRGQRARMVGPLYAPHNGYPLGELAARYQRDVKVVHNVDLLYSLHHRLDSFK